MRKLQNSDLRLITSICKLRQKGLWKTMTQYLEGLYENVYVTSDYILAEGNIPIALVAHLDTVFPTPPSNIYYDEKQGVLWSPDGLGADDRAGVFAILKILRSGLRPCIIFTTDEEQGCLGAGHLVREQPKCFFKNLKYLIQLDRRGTNDCVFYECDNEKFTKYIESFGFIEAIGSFSDISTICPKWKIAGVNLSIGYEDEHSVSETLHVNPLLTTIDKVIQMLNKANEAPKFEFVPCEWYKKWGGIWNAYPTEYDDYEDYWDFYGYGGYPSQSQYNLLTDECECHVCHKKYSEYEVVPVEQPDFTIKYVCPDCLNINREEWCEICGNCFEKKPGDERHICYSCREELNHKTLKKKTTTNLIKSVNKKKGEK